MAPRSKVGLDARWRPVCKPWALGIGAGPGELNAMFPNLDVDGGYCFLNDNGGKTGLIRFYSGYANPKWSFEMKADNEIECGGA